jgi:hypothetical protein
LRFRLLSDLSSSDIGLLVERFDPQEEGFVNADVFALWLSSGLAITNDGASDADGDQREDMCLEVSREAASKFGRYCWLLRRRGVKIRRVLIALDGDGRGVLSHSQASLSAAKATI